MTVQICSRFFFNGFQSNEDKKARNNGKNSRYPTFFFKFYSFLNLGGCKCTPLHPSRGAHGSVFHGSFRCYGDFLISSFRSGALDAIARVISKRTDAGTGRRYHRSVRPSHIRPPNRSRRRDNEQWNGFSAVRRTTATCGNYPFTNALRMFAA